MNTALSEMLHCLQTSGNLAGNGTDVTVLERQRARLKWQQQQQNQQSHDQEPQQSYFNETHFNNFLQLPSTTSNFDQSFINNDSLIRELVNRSIKTDPSLDNGWSNFEKYPVPRTGFGGETTGLSSTGFGTNSLDMTNFSISRTSSCPPEVGNALPPMGIAAVAQEKSRQVGSSEKMASTVGRESFKKRKADKAQNPKVGVAEETKDKRIKVDTEDVESKVTHHEQKNNNNNRETSADTSKDNSKISEVQKPDYIHVRARRGQATDSHSLAERVRREKISERMKYLQDLVPGCNKITGKAGMLDEIINYVQSLQRQVEFLSMKLAAVNPRLDINIDNFFTKDMFPACTGIFPTVGMSQEMANCPTYLQFNPVQEMVSSCGLDMVINPPEMAALRRTISAPISAPETFLDNSCFTQEQPTSTWETDFQNLYNIEEFHQGRPTVFPPQSFTGTLEANNLKMEM